MANVAELAAKIELKGAKEASKAVTDLTSKFGFLGNVAVGVFKGLTWGVEQLNDLRDGAREYAREIDIMTFRNRIDGENIYLQPILPPFSYGCHLRFSHRFFLLKIFRNFFK